MRRTVIFQSTSTGSTPHVPGPEHSRYITRNFHSLKNRSGVLPDAGTSKRSGASNPAIGSTRCVRPPESKMCGEVTCIFDGSMGESQTECKGPPFFSKWNSSPQPSYILSVFRVQQHGVCVGDRLRTRELGCAG